jgi:hypothetical protein
MWIDGLPLEREAVAISGGGRAVKSNAYRCLRHFANGSAQRTVDNVCYKSGITSAAVDCHKEAGWIG